MTVNECFKESGLFRGKEHLLYMLRQMNNALAVSYTTQSMIIIYKKLLFFTSTSPALHLHIYRFTLKSFKVRISFLLDIKRILFLTLAALDDVIDISFILCTFCV